MGQFKEGLGGATQEEGTLGGEEDEEEEKGELSGTEEPTWRSTTPEETNRKHRRYDFCLFCVWPNWV